MERYTKLNQDLKYTTSNEYIKTEDGHVSGEVIERLASFENVYFNILEERSKISDEMEKLRFEGKKNSARFKELMGKKLTITAMVGIFKSSGIE